MNTKTPRLILRDLKQDDFTGLYTISSNPLVFETNDYLPADAIALQIWLEETIQSEGEQPRNSHHNAILLQSTNKLIGWIGFHISDADQHRQVEFGYALNPTYWNQGYMTEAVQAMIAFCFQEIQAHTIMAFHMENNAVSGRVLTKAGMQRNEKMLDKQSDGEIHYVVTAAEWHHV